MVSDVRYFITSNAMYTLTYIFTRDSITTSEVLNMTFDELKIYVLENIVEYRHYIYQRLINKNGEYLHDRYVETHEENPYFVEDDADKYADKMVRKLKTWMRGATQIPTGLEEIDKLHAKILNKLEDETDFLGFFNGTMISYESIWGHHMVTMFIENVGTPF